MERRFYTNDFEDFLKDQADQFKMSPSKKVWHGIYNDIHPGKRWPSVSITLLFVFTLLLVGHLNVQQSPRGYQSNIAIEADVKNLEKENKKQASQKSMQKPFKKITLAKGGVKSAGIVESNKNKTTSTTAEELVMSLKDAPENVNGIKEGSSLDKISSIPQSDDASLLINNTDVTNKKSMHTFIADELLKNATIEATPFNSFLSSEITSSSSEITSSSSIDISKSNDVEGSPNYPNITAVSYETNNTIASAPHLKVRKNAKISWAYYFSPTISYRTYLNQTTNADQAYLGNLNPSPNISFNRKVTHRPSIGLEAGTAMKLSLTKKLKLTSGLQVNYSAYTISANNIHPIVATLVLHNESTGAPYAVSSISYYGNGPGTIPQNIHNYSLQLSLPVGLEYQLTGNDKIQFSAAASFQPSFVASSRAYILSTDKKNYINEPNLSRQWNMGTNIGTFISFNSNKLRWQIGPQVRYQLLSSYVNKYPVKEHLIDYGIRLGVSNLFR
jgi:hypothetical protein